MSFMKPEVYKGLYFQVETTHGTEIVPVDAIGRTAVTHVKALLNYLEGAALDDDERVIVSEGWLARMSAPGYMDCTSWGAYPSESSALAYLDDMYGED